MPAKAHMGLFGSLLYSTVKQVKYTQMVPESHMDIQDHGKRRGCFVVLHLLWSCSQPDTSDTQKYSELIKN